MQYLLMIYADEKIWASLSPAQAEAGMKEYFAYSDALKKAGAMLGGEQLHDTNQATTVSVVNGKTKVMDGPFADTKEQLGGYYVIEAKTLDDAIAWAARCPGAAMGRVEVRPIVAMDK